MAFVKCFMLKGFSDYKARKVHDAICYGCNNDGKPTRWHCITFTLSENHVLTLGRMKQERVV